MTNLGINSIILFLLKSTLLCFSVLIVFLINLEISKVNNFFTLLLTLTVLQKHTLQLLVL